MLKFCLPPSRCRISRQDPMEPVLPC
uniref:Uncharacterized protein n=1 Tax=Arundo donax TaxID=35708 RepID=A0A0A8YDJ9_ARUDO